MINRLFFSLLLLAYVVALSMSANAQIFVLAHTNINDQRHIVPLCETLMQDPAGPANYPGGVSVVCTMNQSGGGAQTLPQCVANPDAKCSVPLGAVIEGANYQTTAIHGLIMQLLTNGCTKNGVLVNCLSDPLSYGVVSVPTLPAGRQFTDFGTISPPFPPVGPTFWDPPVPFTTNTLLASTAETQFQSAQVLPFVLHIHANQDPKTIPTFRLNGLQNAIWTFTGSSGTTTPTAPSQGTTITFNAPNTVPVPQVDTITGCKVDTSHGTDCNSAQIFAEVLSIRIPPGAPDIFPRPDNPTELLGGDRVQYKATVTQGAGDLPPGSPVHWSKNDPSNLLSMPDPTTGFVTVQPQSVFQGGDFVVTIQATSDFDPTVAVSGTFAIHIPTVSVHMTTVPSPGLNDTSTAFRADVGRTFHFVANVTGPQNPQNLKITNWNQVFVPTLFDFSPPGIILQDPTKPNEMDYQITSPPPKGNLVTTTIRACVGGHLDADSLGLADATCDQFPMTFSAPIFVTSPSPTINSGESTTVTITGTGFGAAPVLSFSDRTVSFTPTSISGPDANGVTTVIGTMTSVPVPAPIPFNLVAIPVTITSSLPPPSTPVNQNVFVRPVSATPSVTPVNPTLLVSQSQQFTPTLGCLTPGGQSCTVPQTSTCSLFSGVGTMSASCLYTAPASLAAQAQVTGKACFTFGNICTGFSINLVPVAVALSPAAVSLKSGQSQQLQATVTNAPNNNQGVTWSINPAVGSITSAGLYTAPAVISTTQSITVTACSVVDTIHCSSVIVTLLPPLQFVPVTPCRVADTRNANGPFGGPFLAANVSRGFTVPASACGIPSTAQAYAVNATVIPRGQLGSFTLFPCGQTLPSTSNLNSLDGRTKAVAAIVAAGTNGAVCAYPSSDTDFALDISGYFVPATTSGALAFFPVTPCRIADTRNAVGSLGGPSLVANTARTFPVLSSTCGIPSTAQAYSLNFTAIPPGVLGFLTAWPSGQSQPAVSTLNAVTGAVTANAAVVPAGTSGSINVLASATTDLAIDINGYFAPPATGGLSLVSLTPCRVLDTRNPSGSPAFNGTISVNVTGSGCGAPANAQGYVLNATVIPPGALGFITVWPNGAVQPTVSTLNAIDGTITSNMAIISTTNGSINVFASNPTHLVLDIFGYFAP